MSFHGVRGQSRVRFGGGHVRGSGHILTRAVRAVLPRVLLLAVVVFATTATADDTRRLLELLAGARIAYLEAFEDRGAELESLTELEEARLLVGEARQVNDRLQLLPPADLAAIAASLDSELGRSDVPDRLEALAATVTAKTGTSRVTQPPAPPSAARGRALYRDNCVGCHGATGAGDGVDVRRGEMTPADFTNVVFMRRETPLDFFTMIGLGHRRRGMPEWGESLGVQQRWDLVAHLWTVQESDGE